MPLNAFFMKRHWSEISGQVLSPRHIGWRAGTTTHARVESSQRLRIQPLEPIFSFAEMHGDIILWILSYILSTYCESEGVCFGSHCITCNHTLSLPFFLFWGNFVYVELFSWYYQLQQEKVPSAASGCYHVQQVRWPGAASNVTIQVQHVMLQGAVSGLLPGAASGATRCSK